SQAFLLDGDRGAQPFDALYAGLRELIEELPSVRREGFDVPSLSFGVDRIESQRGLSRSARAGDDDEAVSRKLAAYVLEVVLRGTADDQTLHGSRTRRCTTIWAERRSCFQFHRTGQAFEGAAGGPSVVS